MKKALVALVLACVSATLFSQKIKVESGSTDFLRNEESINVTFTYDDMTVGKTPEESYVSDKIAKGNADAEGKGDLWHRQWIDDRGNRFEPKFVELFNKRMYDKNGPVISRQPGNYLMIVNTDMTEPGFNVGVMRKNAQINLTCIITDARSGNELAVISLKKAPGRDVWGTDFDVAYRIQEAYAKAGSELAKFIIKQLKLK